MKKTRTGTRIKNQELANFKKKMREAIANYMSSEGCSCCRSVDRHKENHITLAKLLSVKKYKDHSGYNFTQYQTQ